jgi:hypothetical protein
LARRCLLSLLISLSATAVGSAQGVGAIGGTITDSSSAVLPGATVTLSNPGTIGGYQVAGTDERRAFQFLDWCPPTP